MMLGNAILRGIPGAFILNAGIGKLGLDAQTAAHLQGMAEKGVPALGKMTPEQFAKFLSYGEIAVGASLLLPFVPKKLAGAALAGFSVPMMMMYVNTPGMTEEDGIRPTQEGTALAKDSWLVAIAAALILQGDGGKAAKKHAKETLKEAKKIARQAR